MGILGTKSFQKKYEKSSDTWYSIISMCAYFLDSHDKSYV